MKNIGLIIIDVLRDFIYDINSPSESTQVSTYFMQWSDEFQVHTCTILHQNKGDNNERGHIGSEFINKAKMVILVEKSYEDKNVSVISVSAIRDKEFEPFGFCINVFVLPEIVVNK